ncbi:MAG: hypothetical protein ACRCTY_08355 [Candidatus Adiutrix sp.]
MIRLFIIAVLFWLIIALVRSSFAPKNPRANDDGLVEEMVCDAFSGIYFKKQDALTITRGGQTYYFISLENRDKFLNANK